MSHAPEISRRDPKFYGVLESREHVGREALTAMRRYIPATINPASSRIDWLLSHPRLAIRVCDAVRDTLGGAGEAPNQVQLGAYELPDSLILECLKEEG